MDNKFKALFEQIGSQYGHKKNIVSLSKKLSKKLSFQSNEDLENLKCLAYWLYIYDDTNNAEQICAIVKDIPNNITADLWTWIESLDVLYARILREKGNNESKKYIDIVLDSYREEQKLLRRILKGSLLYNKKIELYLQDGDEKSANNWRFLQFSKLCFIRELGGSDILPISNVEQEMSEIKGILSK